MKSYQADKFETLVGAYRLACIGTAVLTPAVVHSFMRSSTLLRRFFLLLFLLFPVYASPDSQVGDPQDFAALTIRPDGPEELDLTTGVTTLPQGGEIVYRKEGVTLQGSFIRYLEGDFIEVEGALVKGDFGTLRAPRLRFDVAAQTLTAQGGATFSGEALELSADTLKLNLGDDVAVLEGNVTSTKPELSSQGAVVDLKNPQGLLLGPYSYQDGPVGLKGAAGELLALSWDVSGALSADSQVPEALQTRFAAYLP